MIFPCIIDLVLLVGTCIKVNQKQNPLHRIVYCVFFDDYNFICIISFVVVPFTLHHNAISISPCYGEGK